MTCAQRSKRWKTRKRARLRIGLLACGLTIGAIETARAYDAEIAFDRVGAASRYNAYVRFEKGAGPAPTEPERSVSVLSSVIPESSDGRAHIAITALPLGPTAVFTVTSRANGSESERSNEMRLTYAVVAHYVDTDEDGLLDYEEDLDLDLVVDTGETDSRKADTDGDGLLRSRRARPHRDGSYAA